MCREGEIRCCQACASQLNKCSRKIHKLEKEAQNTLFLKFDSNLHANVHTIENNIVFMPPIKDTWLEWDYGHVVTHYIDPDGRRVDLTDEKGVTVTLNDLSDGEIQAVSPLIPASKIIKLSSSFDDHVGHKVIGHIVTLPTSSNRAIYDTTSTILPRLDVAEYNRILYLGTAGNYSSRIAFRLNARRHVMRQYVTESYLKAMQQANESFANKTRFRKPTKAEWAAQRDAYQGDIIAEPDKSSLDIEEMLRGDIARGWDTTLRTKQTDNSIDAEFSDVMVTKNTPLDPDERVLRQMLQLHNEIQSKDELDTPMTVQIKDNALNDYTKNPELLHFAFPLLFPLGVTARQIRTTGLMHQSTIRRLLCSADGRFARAKTFLFHLMNQKMRHDNNRSVALRINSNTEMSKKIVAFVNSEEFDALCVAASANPKGPAARALLAKVRPLVSLSGRATKWSALERAAVKGKLFSLTQIFTPSALFLTFAPKVLDCDLVIRLAAIQLGLTDAEIREVMNPEGLNQRVRIVSDNPIAQARAFQHMIRGFCNIILGLPQWNETKPRADRINRPKGLFGTPLAYCGPIETQHRGSLHLHVLVQIAELRPALLQRFAHDPKVMQTFTR